MISAEVDFVVNRPVEEVFAFLSDFVWTLMQRRQRINVRPGRRSR